MGRRKNFTREPGMIQRKEGYKRSYNRLKLVNK